MIHTRLVITVLCSIVSLLTYTFDQVYAEETGSVIESEIIPNDKIIQDSDEIKKATKIINQYINREGEEILLDIVKNNQPGRNKALFMLGRLYKEEKNFDAAEQYLLEAYRAYPLLSDYTLKLLLGVYVESGQHEKVIEKADLITNPLLVQHAKKIKMSSLLALNMDKQAAEVFSAYVKAFPGDWQSKLTFAALLNMAGNINQSIKLYKEIYIHAVPESDTALSELKVLEADQFTDEEILARADNLYKQYAFRIAEKEYLKVLPSAEKEAKDDIVHAIGMCQFRTKRYNESALTFGQIDSPKALYWQARSYYRISKNKEFAAVKKLLEDTYPDDTHVGTLLLMEAEEYQRKKKIPEADAIFKEVAARFPKSAERALWGLGWIAYMEEDYRASLDYFTKLSAFDKSRSYFKYLFWQARAKEEVRRSCKNISGDPANRETDVSCTDIDEHAFFRLPSDESYYGYLIKFRSADAEAERPELVRPEIPVNETIRRIEDLSFLGMKDEAAEEVASALKNTSSDEELLYLAYTGLTLGKYKDVIYQTEPKHERVFLPYSYPRAYWDIISSAAEKEDLDAYLISALIREESRYDSDIVSWAGAIGLMQLLPSTAKRIDNGAGLDISSASELFDPEKNIKIGSHYLSTLIKDFKELPLAIMSYNAGERVVEKWLKQFYRGDMYEFIENIPYKETRRYVKKVLKSYWQYRSINGISISSPENQAALQDVKS